MEAEFLNACENGRTDVIDSLIDQVNINCVDIYGNTGLIFACDRNGPWILDVVTRLLQHDIDVNIGNIYGICALEAVLYKDSPNFALASLILVCSKHSINNRDYSAMSREGMNFLRQNGFTYNDIDTTGVLGYTIGFAKHMYLKK